MKKKLLTSILIIAIFLAIPTIVYAAYSGIKQLVGSATTGNIVINSKNYVIYTYDDASTNDVDESSTTICETSTNNATYAISGGRINCYANQKRGASYEEDYIQMNQLGFSFSFTNQIDVYVRIRIEDSWVSTKIYRNGTVRTQIVLKDDSALNDALTGSSDWIYDAESGYIYYKTKVSSNNSNTLSLKFDEDYYYTTTTTTTYFETIAVTFAYQIDIVQANRAELKWGVDLDSILGGNG